MAGSMMRNVEVVDEQVDMGSGVGAADADVVQAAVGPQRDAPGLSRGSVR